MVHRVVRRSVRTGSVGVMVACLAVAGCATPAPTAPPGTAEPNPTATARALATPSPSDRPPDATLAAEGGDPVAAQLGTYTWGESGADSPWLPGSRISVGRGEPLAIAFDRPIGVARWTADYVPAFATDGSGAASLGRGGGPPLFPAPPAGSWTLVVTVRFAGDAGEARYFWRLEVF